MMSKCLRYSVWSLCTTYWRSCSADAKAILSTVFEQNHDVKMLTLFSMVFEYYPLAQLQCQGRCLLSMVFKQIVDVKMLTLYSVWSLCTTYYCHSCSADADTILSTVFMQNHGVKMLTLYSLWSLSTIYWQNTPNNITALQAQLPHQLQQNINVPLDLGTAALTYRPLWFEPIGVNTVYLTKNSSNLIESMYTDYLCPFTSYEWASGNLSHH